MTDELVAAIMRLQVALAILEENQKDVAAAVLKLEAMERRFREESAKDVRQVMQELFVQPSREDMQ